MSGAHIFLLIFLLFCCNRWGGGNKNGKRAFGTADKNGKFHRTYQIGFKWANPGSSFRGFKLTKISFNKWHFKFFKRAVADSNRKRTKSERDIWRPSIFQKKQRYAVSVKRYNFLQCGHQKHGYNKKPFWDNQ